MKPSSSDASDRFKEISSWISSAHDVDQHLELIMGTVSQMMRAKVVSLMLADQESKKLYLMAAIGEMKQDREKREIDLGKGITGYVAEKGEPIAVSDVTKDSRWDREPCEFTGLEVYSIACAPVKIGNETIGVIEVINKVDGSSFQDDDLKILSVHAEAAALAIEKARKEGALETENGSFREELCSKYQIIGQSDSLQMVISEAFKVAKSRASTLILGESGTG
jgi:transcriptional regulator with GAF, ATPase, and Fis domain